MVENVTEELEKKEAKKELLDPKLDYVFKRIFGHAGNEEITKGLLSAIIKEPINDITLDCNPITEKDLLDDKFGILDIKAKLNNNTSCNIEMQVVDKKNVEKRILFYWSQMYIKTIKSTEDYKDLEKCIVILFVDYNLKNLEGENYFTKWNIREEKNTKIILTDVLEIYIIELNKVKENKQNKDLLNLWVQFINNPEATLNMENEEIKKAKKVLEEISQDEDERYKADLRKKYIRDQKAIADAGFDKGLEAGIKQGIKKGIEQGIEQIAKKMKQKNKSIEEIIEFTGLSKEQIDEIETDEY